MDQTQQKQSPLDQLQIMFNAVLQHTASVFVEARKGADNDKAIVAAARLRTIAPQANNNFQDALDELESELTTARWVLRRDLAFLRRQQLNKPSGANAAKSPPALPPADIEMSDAMDIDAKQTNAANQESVVESIEPETNGTLTTSPKVEESKPKIDLQIDTATRPPGDDVQPEPTTGGMSAMDFDSLFNDSDSATATGATATPTQANPSDSASKPVTSIPAEASTALADPNPDADENISSLLPGLESYANESNGDAIDLSTPDGKSEAKKADDSADKADQQTNDSKDKDGETQTQKETQTSTQTSTEQRDTTFDDLMNFNDFDLASFGVGEGGMDDGGGATFDESFFNID